MARDDFSMIREYKRVYYCGTGLLSSALWLSEIEDDIEVKVLVIAFVPSLLI